jgi:excinuclease ABC subunit A
LKGIDVEIPIGKLVVVTGPSGSGKSSLAFDTLYAEGQRRYVETFSPYTRQFLDRMDKPRVDELSGTPPAIAIEQVNAVKTSRSTVGSLTEINDYFKLLFPRVAEGRCPQCGRTIVPESAPTIREVLFREFAGEQVHVTFPLAVPPGTQAADFFPFLQGQGYLRVLLFGKLLRTDEGTRIGTLPAYVSVVQDRVLIENANRGRIAEAIEAALRLGGGRMEVVGDRAARRFSSGWHCAECDLEIEPPTPALFSFNHPHGACPRCKGFGRTIAIDYGKVIPDGGLSLEGGAIKPFQTENGRECQRDLLRCAAERGMALTVPWAELSQADRDWVIHGERGADVLAVSDAEELWREGLWYGVAGFFSWLESRAYKMHVRVLLSRYRDYTTCPDCRGGRLRNEARNYRFAGLTFPEWMALPAGRMLDEVLVRLPRDDGRPEVTLARDQLVARLRYLIEVGLPYLSIDRTARTLSGGELQRVNLTTCLGASLTDTLFVLDEPSIGLHSRDTDRLIRILRGLRDLGNTVVVVEHEESVIRAADELLEIGPGRGAHGGELVFQGPCERLIQSARRGHTSSLTGAYLAGTKRIPVPLSRRSPRGFLSVRGARAHNLRSLDIEIPLGVLVCVTGVSGSGKSTLVHEIIFKELGGSTIGATDDELRVAGGAVFGWDATVGEVVLVDQSPLTRTPKSCTALYLGVFDHIRELLARTPDAQRGGFSAAAFSFNTGVGRCERCSGAGFEKIEMQFLSDVYVRCLECEGQRYQKSVLEVRLNGRNVHEILELTVSDALVAFGGIGSAAMLTPLALMEEVGLGYLTLGQPLNLLSGGESQRVKLVERLARGSGGGDLLILDEPTTGLHFDDVAMLVRLLQRLVDEGNSLLVIEHNLELIKCADHIVDLGPEGGLDGGHLVVQGTPEVVAASGLGYTSRFLRDALAADALGAGDLEAEGLMAAEAHRPVAALQPGRHAIAIRGAREHNLKNIDLDVPRGQLVVITGLSGSGKSTLAFDLLFAEGQRRFMDCMSAYARQFVEQLEKPDVDLLAGLPPTVAIEQRVTRGGGKSTVATVTEVYHFLRLLFAKAGVQWCPDCAVPVDTQTVSAVIAKVEEAARSGRIQLFAALVKGRKGFHTDVARWAVKNGFEWLLVDGAMIRSEDFKPLDRFKEHRIEVLVGERKSPDRVRELVKRALELGKGTVRLMDHRKRSTLLSTERACPVCSRSFDALDPRLF